MFKIFDAIKEFFGTIFDLIGTVIESILTLIQVLVTGIPSLIATLADMPGFLYSGMLVTISICLMLVLVGRRSS